MSQEGHRPHDQGSHAAHKRWASRWSHVNPSPGPSPPATPQAHVLASQLQLAKDQARIFLVPAILPRKPLRHLPDLAGSSECQQPVPLSPPQPPRWQATGQAALGEDGALRFRDCSGHQDLGWRRGPRGTGPQPRAAWLPGSPSIRRGVRYAPQEPSWRSETCPRTHGSLGLPQRPQGLAACSGLCTHWGLCLPSWALSSDCFHGVGIFSHLWGEICLFDDKRLIPSWGGSQAMQILLVLQVTHQEAVTGIITQTFVGPRTRSQRNPVTSNSSTVSCSLLPVWGRNSHTPGTEQKSTGTRVAVSTEERGFYITQ